MVPSSPGGLPTRPARAPRPRRHPVPCREGGPVGYRTAHPPFPEPLPQGRRKSVPWRWENEHRQSSFSRTVVLTLQWHLFPEVPRLPASHLGGVLGPAEQHMFPYLLRRLSGPSLSILTFCNYYFSIEMEMSSLLPCFTGTLWRVGLLLFKKKKRETVWNSLKYL